MPSIPSLNTCQLSDLTLVCRRMPQNEWERFEREVKSQRKIYPENDLRTDHQRK